MKNLFRLLAVMAIMISSSAFSGTTEDTISVDSPPGDPCDWAAPDWCGPKDPPPCKPFPECVFQIGMTAPIDVVILNDDDRPKCPASDPHCDLLCDVDPGHGPDCDGSGPRLAKLERSKPKPKKTPKQACEDGGGTWKWTAKGGQCTYPV